MTDKPEIGFIGIGQMGEGMARRLLAAGYPLTIVAHRKRARIDQLIAEGAREAPSLAGLAASCKVIILCVSNAAAVAATVDDLRPALSAGSIIIDTSTSDPALTRRLAEELAADGIHFCDGPLTGGVAQAAAGELGVLFGGPADILARVEPVLSSFATRIEHFGSAGSGHVAKLVNNYLVCGMIALIADTYNAARDLGVDWQKLYSVMQQGSNNSGALQRIVGNAINGDFDGYRFSLANAHKDMNYFVKLGDGLSGPSALATVVMDEFDDAMARGMGDMMVSRLIDPDLQEYDVKP
jgi:3-hydroxyisobutyrate dehydrogenase-like beta-hydroxyacid dehydrogenase